MSTLRSALGPVLLLAPALAQTTGRVSVSTGGAQANDSCSTPSVSVDGRYVAFFSYATTLVGGDTNASGDVFVRDRHQGVTERASVATGGAQGDGHSFGGSITPDGRRVVFLSYSTNLVAGDANAAPDVFVRDRQAGTTERVSLGAGGVEANAGSGDWMSLSDDGRYVAFSSVATNLVAGDTNGDQDVFVRDRVGGTTVRASVTAGGGQGNALSRSSFLSGGGRYVVFLSDATNLVAGDTNAATDVFLRDLQAGTTERISVSTGGVQGNGECNNRPSVSTSGLLVAFDSQASNLSGGDTNAVSDLFVRDRVAGTTFRASLGPGGIQPNGGTSHGMVAAGGRFVAYSSLASNLVAGDANGAEDVFLHDLTNGITRRVSVSTAGAEGNAGSNYTAISAGGQFVAFRSGATNLVPLDTNLQDDVFLRDRIGTGSMQAFCLPGDPNVPNCPCGNPPSGAGLGCDNFGAGPADSGRISATGAASLASDTIVLAASGENNTSLTVFWQGRDPLPAVGLVHGAGVRCVNATLRRLYTGAASGGAIQRPGGGDPTVSARSAAVGDPILPGQNRHYFTIYRDPAAAGPCGNPGSTVNLTNAGTLLWGP